MNKRKLGKLGESVLPLGFGCASIGGYYTRKGRVASRGQVDDAETIRAIHAALDHGIQLFDVGNIYGAGHAERVLGRALVGRRSKAVLQVKFGASLDEVTRQQIDYGEGVVISAEMIRNSLEASLRRLQTDVIDIFQFQVGNYPIDQLPEILNTLNALRDEGKIRAYSYGSGDIEQVRAFVEAPHCATIITSHNVLTDRAALLDFLDANNVALLAGVPLYMGLLSGKITAASQFDNTDLRAGWPLGGERFASVLARVEALRELLTCDGRTMAQGALAWLWAQHHRTIPVVGFRTVAQVVNSAEALSFGPLSDEIMQAIARSE